MPPSSIRISVFFLRKKNQPFRENYLILLRMSAWKFWSFRDNILKTASEINQCARENFSCITSVKIVKSVRKKNNYVDSILMKILYFVPVKNEMHTWKFSKNIYILPVKTKIHTWKNLSKCPWKFFSARENFQKSVRESDFLSVKKPKNWPKKSFTHTFDFHAGKKNTVI